MSDNGTCFKNEEVRFSEELTRMNICWKFIVAASPWWRGFWERLVQSVKRSLRKILFRSTENYEELVTIVTEIEGTITCRPLIYIYNDNAEEAVTPSHLIYGRRLLSKPSNDKPDNFNVENLTRRMKYLHTLIQEPVETWIFKWTPWIPQMRERRHTHKCRWYCTCWNPTLKRSDRELGKITTLIKGHDERLWAATVKIYNNNSIHQLINRPMKLFH